MGVFEKLFGATLAGQRMQSSERKDREELMNIIKSPAQFDEETRKEAATQLMQQLPGGQEMLAASGGNVAPSGGVLPEGGRQTQQFGPGGNLRGTTVHPEAQPSYDKVYNPDTGEELSIPKGEKPAKGFSYGTKERPKDWADYINAGRVGMANAVDPAGLETSQDLITEGLRLAGDEFKEQIETQKKTMTKPEAGRPSAAKDTKTAAGKARIKVIGPDGNEYWVDKTKWKSLKTRGFKLSR